MIKPELFDVIEILIDLPKYNLNRGEQGTIVECYNDNHYQVEFANHEGESLNLYTLSTEQFIVV